MDNRSCSSITMFKLKKEQAAISTKKKKGKFPETEFFSRKGHLT